MAASRRPLETKAHDSHQPETALLFLRDLLKTRHARETLGILIPEIAALWAGDNPLKKGIARPLGKVFAEGVRSGQRNGARDVPSPDALAGRIDTVLPVLVDTLASIADSVLSGIEDLPAERRAAVFKAILGAGADDRFGALTTRALQLVAGLHQSHPRLITEAVMPVFRAWYEKTDFGELRDFLDGATEDAAALAEALNDLLWTYPAKLVLILSLLPDMANAVVGIAAESVSRFNAVSPDLVADIVLSLLRQVDGEAVGKCVAELAELTRKLHTGSALIGEPGRPRFLDDLARLLASAAPYIDGKTLAKARVALAEDREAIRRTIADTVFQHPEIGLAQLRCYAKRINPDIRSCHHQLSLLEEQPEGELSEALREGFSSVDVQAAAEIANLASLLFNRLCEASPGTLETLAAQFTDVLDLEEVQSAADHVVTALGQTLRPVGRAVLPGMIRELCAWMSPEDDFYEAEMAQARQALRTLLNGEEGSA